MRYPYILRSLTVAVLMCLQLSSQTSSHQFPIDFWCRVYKTVVCEWLYVQVTLPSHSKPVNLLLNCTNLIAELIRRQPLTFAETIICVCVHRLTTVISVLMCCFSFSILNHKCQAFGQVAQLAFTLVGKLWDGCRGRMPQTVVTWCLKATCCCCFCMLLHIFQT